MSEHRREHREVRRVHISEAAEAMGVSKDAVRMRIRRGTLESDVSQGGFPSGFREACNKVLHAGRVEPRHTPAGSLTHLSLHGSFRGKDWQALLDLMSFALSAHRLTP